MQQPPSASRLLPADERRTQGKALHRKIPREPRGMEIVAAPAGSRSAADGVERRPAAGLAVDPLRYSGCLSCANWAGSAIRVQIPDSVRRRIRAPPLLRESRAKRVTS